MEGRSRVFHEESALEGKGASPATAGAQVSKQQRLENIRNALEGRKLYKEGRLVHKPEPELKTHTSYLVFAVLPREWTEENELEAQRLWPGKVDLPEQDMGPMSKRQRKKEAKAKAGGNKASEIEQESSSSKQEAI